MRSVDKLKFKLWLGSALCFLLLSPVVFWIHPALGVVVMAAVLIGLNVVYFMKLACPACKGSLLLSPGDGYIRRRIPEECPHCGTLID